MSSEIRSILENETLPWSQRIDLVESFMVGSLEKEAAKKEELISVRQAFNEITVKHPGINQYIRSGFVEINGTIVDIDNGGNQQYVTAVSLVYRVKCKAAVDGVHCSEANGIGDAARYPRGWLTIFISDFILNG